MKNLVFLTFLLLLENCAINNGVAEKSVDKLVVGDTALKYSKTIDANEIKEHVYSFASDEFEGRYTGENGQKKAANYLRDFYIKNEIISPLGSDDYFQEIPTEHLRKNLQDSENVIAYIKGSSKPEEIIVISAHYDHLGIKKEEIYNGADDNGSGTIAIIEIAQAFQKAVEDGYKPKRSIVFLHLTGEERGLLGSKYYTNFPIFPLENTVTNLNIDMIGRVDDAHKDNPNYIYIIGSNFLSTELHNISEKVNSEFTNLTFDYKFNTDDDPNRYYYRSDHYNFAKNNIPVIFYFNGVHQDYHKPSDTPDKINYDLLAKRAQLIFLTAWELANRKDRVIVDKTNE